MEIFFRNFRRSTALHLTNMRVFLIMVALCSLVAGARSSRAHELPSHELVWNQGSGATECIDESTARTWVARHIGRELTEGQPRAVEVTLSRAAPNAWLAELILLPEGGRRVLRVPGENCYPVAQYAALAAALMIDPSLSLDSSPQEPPGSPAESGAAPDDGGEPAEQTESRDELESRPNVEGTGRIPVLLLPSVIYGEVPAGWYRAALAAVHRGLKERLSSRKRLTVLHSERQFEERAEAEAWIQRAVVRGVSPFRVSGRGRLMPTYALVSVLSRLQVRDAIDYTPGKKTPAYSATARLTLTLVDLKELRRRPEITVETTLSYAADDLSDSDRLTTIRLVMERLAEMALDRLRIYDDFRLTGRVHRSESQALTGRVTFSRPSVFRSGDHFAFVDDQGNVSGHVVLKSVEGESASWQVRKKGRGDRLVEIGAYRRWTFSQHIDYGFRLAYRFADEDEVARAASEGRIVRAVGDRGEVGVNLGALMTPQGPSPWRGLVHLRSALVLGQGFGYSYQMDAGVGVELPLLPSIGLVALPRVGAGLTVWYGEAAEGDAAFIEEMLGPHVAAGVQLEFFQTKTISPMIDFGGQLVLPLDGTVAASSFLGDRFPSLHGFTIGVGVVARIPKRHPTIDSSRSPSSS